VFAVNGFGFAGQGQNVGLAFISLKPFCGRADHAKKSGARHRPSAVRAMGASPKIKDGMVFAVAPPAIPGFGNASGFDFYLQDSGAGHEKLMAKARNQLLGLLARRQACPAVAPERPGRPPQYNLDIDQPKASALGINLADINATLSAAWGGSYVNDFIDRGRVKQVYVQGDAPFRMQPRGYRSMVRAQRVGSMVPFSAFASGRWTYGSPRLERYNGVGGCGDPGRGRHPAPVGHRDGQRSTSR
jgi:multidrug efflux pump subunit AcrB